MMKPNDEKTWARRPFDTPIFALRATPGTQDDGKEAMALIISDGIVQPDRFKDPI